MLLKPKDQVKVAVIMEKILTFMKSAVQFFDVFRFMKYFFPDAQSRKLGQKKSKKKNTKFIYNYIIQRKYSSHSGFLVFLS